MKILNHSNNSLKKLIESPIVLFAKLSITKLKLRNPCGKF